METLPSYPCQQVVGEGQLCSMPCDPGFVRCNEHRNYSDKRALADMLARAQDRVLRRVEMALDDAVQSMIDLSLNGPPNVRLAAADKILTLMGFANLKIEHTAGGEIEPSDRDRILMGLIRTYVQDPTKLAELERKAGAIDVKLTDNDGGTQPE